jgi:hypothetical protein
VRAKWFILELFGLAASFAVAAALGYVSIVANDWLREGANERRMKLLSAQAEATECALRSQEELRRSEAEIIGLLGSIDLYVRVLELETDVNRRTLALQSAQGILTTIAAKLASGALERAAVSSSEVAGMALQTHRELHRLQLHNDRIAADLTRIFGVSAYAPGSAGHR